MSTRKNKSFHIHKYYMNLAFLQAKNCIGNTGTNPPVGCVITNKKNKLIAIGKTSFGGRPHAEINAIRSNKKEIIKGNLYATLEPCAHYGKTKPCVNSIIKSKINKVFFSINDIDERTYKKSKKILNNRNIKVNKGLIKNKISNFYKFYRKNRNKQLPYVISKMAISKDNFIKHKSKRYITNEYSRMTSHILRYESDAILITYKTLMKDNPILNCRIKSLENFSPKRFILDKNLQISLNSKIVNTANKYETIIFFNKVNKKKMKKLKNRKIRLINLKLNNYSNFDLKHVLKEIYLLKVSRLLVEGGKALTNNLLDNNLIDEFYLFKSESNILRNGRINVKSLLKKIEKKSKNKKLVITNLKGNKLFNYKF